MPVAPRTLPADFDFAVKAAPRTLPADFQFGGEAPKALPADFDFKPQRATVPGTEQTGLPGVPLIDPRKLPVNELPEMGAADLLPTSVAALPFGIGKGAASSALGIGAILDPIGKELSLQPVEKVGQMFQGWKAEVDKANLEGLRAYEGKSLSTHPELATDPAYMLNLTGNAVGSIVSFFLPGKAAAKGAEFALAKAAPQLVAARPMLAKLAEVTAGSGAGSALETLMNATDNFTAAQKEYGASEGAALRVFEEHIKREAPWTFATNLAGLYSPRLKSLWARVAQGAADAGLEGFQEVKQGDIAHEVLTDELGLKRGPASERPGRIEEAVGAVLGGGLVSGARRLNERAGQQPGQAPGTELAEVLTETAAPVEAPAETLRTRAEAFIRERGSALTLSDVAEGLEVRPGEARAVLDELARDGVVSTGDDGGRAVWQAAPPPAELAGTEGTADVVRLASAVEQVPDPPSGFVLDAPADATAAAPPASAQAVDPGPSAPDGRTGDTPASTLPSTPPPPPARTGGRATTPRPGLPQRTASYPPVYGRETSIAVPGETQKYKARYAVRELADVQASHLADSFERNPAYEHQNDRDYKQPGNAARVIDNAGRFDPEFLLTDSPTAEQGASIIDQRGNVLGGNNRRMTLGRVYQFHPEAAAQYKAQLQERAAQFGIDPAAVAQMKQPVLVRERTDAPADAQREITDYNKTAAAKLNPGEQAVTDGRRLSDRTLERIVGQLEDAGDEGSLADALRGDNGAAILQSLVSDGVLTEQEKNAYVDERDSLTAEGKARVAKALVGRLFSTPQQWNQTAPELRNKLERIAPHVARVEGRGEWKLAETVREALDVLEDARVHKTRNLDDLAGQANVDGRTYSPQAVAVAKVLQQSPVKAAQAFRRYANDEALSREGAQGAFFDPPTQAEAFAEAFEGRAVFASRVKPFSSEAPIASRSDRLPEPETATTAEEYLSGAVVRVVEREGVKGIEVNSPGMVMIEGLFGRERNEEAVGIGELLTTHQVRQLLRGIRGHLKGALFGKGGGPKAEFLRKLYRAIRQAGGSEEMDPRSGIVLVNAGEWVPDKYYEATWKEETDHLRQVQVDGLAAIPADAKVFFTHPLARKARRALGGKGQLYEGKGSSILFLEVGVRLMRPGRHEEIGLTIEEAAELADAYRKLMLARHGWLKPQAIVSQLERTWSNAWKQRKTSDAGRREGGSKATAPPATVQEHRGDLPSDGEGARAADPEADPGDGDPRIQAKARPVRRVSEDEVADGARSQVRSERPGHPLPGRTGHRGNKQDSQGDGPSPDAGTTQSRRAALARTPRRDAKATEGVEGRTEKDTALSLFGPDTDAGTRQDAARDRAKLDAERVTAEWRSPLNRHNRQQKAKPAQEHEGQEGLFAEEKQASLYLGSGLGALQPWFDKPHRLDILNPRLLARKLNRSVLREAVNFFAPLDVRLANEGQGAGADLMAALRRAGTRGEVRAGQRLVRLVDAKLDKLTKAQRFALLDALEGRTDILQAEELVQRAFVVVRQITNEIAAEAQSLDMMVARGDGAKVPFLPMPDYYPHVMHTHKVDALKSGPVRADVVANLTRRKIAKDRAAAEGMLDGYIAYLEGGAQPEAVLQHLVDSGQAANKADALAKMQRFRSHVKKHGNLEFAREVNLPFYDPDPARVMPMHVAGTSIRLAQVAELGQAGQVVNREIRKIQEAGGNPDFARAAVDRIIGFADRANDNEEKLSRLLRSINGFKLGLAAIPNASQTINILLKADLRAFGAGWRSLLSHSGRRFAIEAGATIEPVLHESVREMAGTSRYLDTYLRATGFSTVERANRIVAANAGAQYAKRMLDRAVNGKTAGARRQATGALSELGIEADAAVARGHLTAEEVLTAAKRMSDLTQFRARPEDVPFFASSPMGKMFFQFKSFAYNQTRLLHQSIIGELRSGNYGRAMRNLFLLGVIFPGVGELVASLRAWVRGMDRDAVGLERYLQDIMAVGGLGILADALARASWGKFAEFLTGPTPALAGDVASAGIKIADPRTSANEKKTAALRFVRRHAPQPVSGLAERLLAQ